MIALILPFSLSCSSRGYKQGKDCEKSFAVAAVDVFSNNEEISDNIHPSLKILKKFIGSTSLTIKNSCF